MVEASISVDLFNPGQVFACLGFLEAADVLCGDAEAGFDWSDRANVRFRMRAGRGEHPFATVLQFLAEAQVNRCIPVGYVDALTKGKLEPDDEEDMTLAGEPSTVDGFPAAVAAPLQLPVCLSREATRVVLDHWADGSSRNDFKLYAGNRSAHSIASTMLRGAHQKPRKNGTAGDVKTLGVAALWSQRRDELAERPFDVLTPMGGSFNFDPRGAWTAIDAGYSPNLQDHGVEASPIVQILAAWGMEHARPEEYEKRQVRYAAWSALLPPMLARPALAGVDLAIPLRRFQFELDLSGKNKVVTFAQEEAV